MSPRAAGWLAWSLVAVFVVLHVACFWLVWRADAEGDELFSVVTVGYLAVGALIAIRRPGNAVGWLLMAIAVAFAVETFGYVYASVPTAPGHVPVAWVSAWAWQVWVTLTVTALPLLFPDGRLLSRRWRPVAWSAGLALALGIVGVAFKPGDLDLSVPLDNPLGASGRAADVVALAEVLGTGLTVVCAALAAVSLVLRFRRATGVERQQLKWFALAGLLALAGLMVALVAVVSPGGWRNPVGAVGWFTFLFSCTIGLPAATGVAILRHRLYDIDLVIKRTLVYGSLTAVLVATYLGLVLVLRLALGQLTGESDLAVAGSTLAVAALFRPARARIQHVVDRRFYRSRYDAARTLEGFSVRLRDELDLETLGTDLRCVVRDTMQPAHVSLWLREAAR